MCQIYPVEVLQKDTLGHFFPKNKGLSDQRASIVLKTAPFLLKVNVFQDIQRGFPSILLKKPTNNDF